MRVFKESGLRVEGLADEVGLGFRVEGLVGEGFMVES